MFEGGHPQKAASGGSVATGGSPAHAQAESPPPSYLAAMAQRSRGETFEARVSDLYAILVDDERGAERAFTERQVRTAVAAALGVDDLSAQVAEDGGSSRAETPEHLGCFLNPCRECVPRE